MILTKPMTWLFFLCLRFVLSFFSSCTNLTTSTKTFSWMNDWVVVNSHSFVVLSCIRYSWDQYLMLRVYRKSILYVHQVSEKIQLFSNLLRRMTKKNRKYVSRKKALNTVVFVLMEVDLKLVWTVKRRNNIVILTKTIEVCPHIASIIIKMTLGLNKLHFIAHTHTHKRLCTYNVLFFFSISDQGKQFLLFANVSSHPTRDTLYSTIKSKRHNIKFYDCLRYYVDLPGVFLQSVPSATQ